MTEQQIKVLITDDQAIVRKGIRALLATEANIEVRITSYNVCYTKLLR